MTAIEQRGQSNTVEAGGTPPVYLLHGAFAVPDAVKGYSVIEVQQGMVTAFDDESITITSPDGFTKTYRVDVNTPLVAPGTRVTAMQPAGGLVYLTEVGEPPADGARLSALVPVVPLPR